MGSLRVGHDWAASLSLFTFAFHFHALEKEMATHSSVLAWTRDGGVWWAAAYGVSQSQTRLKRLSSSSRIRLRVSLPLQFSERVWAGNVLDFLETYGRICWWSHLALVCVFWKILGYSFDFWLICSYFLFLPGSVLDSYTFLRICPFLPGCPFYWYIVAWSSRIWSFLFLCFSINFLSGWSVHWCEWSGVLTSPTITVSLAISPLVGVSICLMCWGTRMLGAYTLYLLIPWSLHSILPCLL